MPFYLAEHGLKREKNFGGEDITAGFMGRTELRRTKQQDGRFRKLLQAQNRLVLYSAESTATPVTEQFKQTEGPLDSCQEKFTQQYRITSYMVC